MQISTTVTNQHGMFNAVVWIAKSKLAGLQNNERITVAL
jgi:hypothetical protein